jgi:hypothetical protein
MTSTNSFKEYGFSDKMGPQLRQVVERLLREDLLHYGIQSADWYFDWSDSCLEGRDAAWLDGHIENYSGIALLDQHGRVAVEGWMEFIVVGELLLVYWDDLTSWSTTGVQQHKKTFGIPLHIWQRIPSQHQSAYAAERMRDTPRLP